MNNFPELEWQGSYLASAFSVLLWLTHIMYIQIPLAFVENSQIIPAAIKVVYTFFFSNIRRQLGLPEQNTAVYRAMQLQSLMWDLWWCWALAKYQALFMYCGMCTQIENKPLLFWVERDHFVFQTRFIWWIRCRERHWIPSIWHNNASATSNAS